MKSPFYMTKKLAKAILKRLYKRNIVRRLTLYIVLRIDYIRYRIQFYSEPKNCDFAADVTTLIKWNRPPVGMVRVQLEIIRHLLDLHEHCAFFYFSEDRKRIIRLKPEIVRECCDNFPNAPKFPWPEQKSTAQFLFQRALRIRPRQDSAFLDSIQEPQIELSTSFLKGSKLVLTGLDWLYGNFSLLYALKRKWGFSVISCSHDDIFIHQPEFADNIAHAQSIFLYKYHISCISDHIACVSNHSKDSLSKVWGKYSFPAKESKLSVVKLGFDAIPPNTSPSVPTLLLDSGPQNGIAENFVIYVGSIEPRKNHMILLKTWEKLVNNDFIDLPDLLFIGATWGEYEEQLQRYISSNHKLESKVRFLNGVSGSELLYLYLNAQFTVFPSYAEGWGLPASESLHYGTPCIISDCPALTEATQGLMPIVAADDLEGWVTWVQKFCNQEQRTHYQEIIRREFQFKCWKDFAAEFVACAEETG